MGASGSEYGHRREYVPGSAGPLGKRNVNAQNPDIVAVLIGINDVWRQFDSPFQPESHVLPEEYAANLRRIAAQQAEHPYRLIFLSPFFLEPHCQDPMRARMDEYGAIMRTVAQENGIPFVDLQQAFAALRWRTSTLDT